MGCVDPPPPPKIGDTRKNDNRRYVLRSDAEAYIVIPPTRTWTERWNGKKWIEEKSDR